MASLNTIITLELAAEDRERIDKLIAALERREPVTVTMDTLKGLTRPEPEAPAAPKQTPPEPEKQQPEPEAPAASEKAAPAVKAEDIQAKVVELIGKGKKAEVKAIIKPYAERVNAVPEDKRAEVMAKLSALEG